MPAPVVTTYTHLALDTSGEHPDNKVLKEPHTLADFRFRAIAPRAGAFFADSLVIREVSTGRVLIPGQDYKYLVPYQTPSLMYSKDIVGAAIVINPDINKEVEIDYQALGADYTKNIPAIVDLLNTDNLSQVSDSYLDIQNKRTKFLPSPHLHDLGDGMGFEYLIFALESLARVFMMADAGVVESMLERISLKLNEITKNSKYRLDSEFIAHLLEFKKKFNKKTLGLEHVPNYPQASDEEAQTAAADGFTVGSEINNRLMTLKGLVAFRQALLDKLVLKDMTNLGKSQGVYMLPSLVALEQMVNGSRVIIDSIDANTLAGYAPEISIYPDRSNPTHKWAITKITNPVIGRGGVYQAFNMDNGQMYTGVMQVTSQEIHMQWKKHLTSSDTKEAMDKLEKHIQDRQNPHQVKAHNVNLGLLENLKIADRETILGRKPVREYLTYDGLLLFFSAFITGDWTIDDSEGADPVQKQKARNAYTTLFASAGICDCEDDALKIEIAPRGVQPAPPVRGQPAGWYCEGKTKVAKFTDGFGGYYIENETNSKDCGFVQEVVNYHILDQDNNTIGLGFKAGGRVDKDATVALQDGTGTTQCFIYPVSALGRTALIRNAQGEILGYAIDPPRPINQVP